MFNQGIKFVTPKAWLGICLICVWTASVGALSKESIPAAAEVSVPELIKTLGADDVKVREQAMDQLVKRGPAIREDLNAALSANKDNLDLTLLLNRIIRKWDQSRILERYDAPKKIDLEVKAVPVSKVLDTLFQHFGWRVRASEEINGRRVTIDAKELTFFQALEHLRKEARAYYRSGEEGEGDIEPNSDFGFELAETKEGASYFAHAVGPVLVYLQGWNLHKTRALTLGSGPAQGTEQFCLTGVLVTEPGLPHALVTARETVLANTKGTLPTQVSFNGSEIKLPNSAIGTKNYNLMMYGKPPEALEEMLHLTCALEFDVPLEVISKRVDDLSEIYNKPFEFGGAVCIFREPVESKDGWQILYDYTGSMDTEMRIAGGGGDDCAIASATSGGAGNGQKTKGAPTYEPGMFFLDKDGYLLSVGGEGSTSNNHSTQISQSLNGRPHAMVINMIGQTAKRSYEVAIKEIKLK